MDRDRSSAAGREGGASVEVRRCRRQGAVAMGEYERIGEGLVFWRRHGDDIRTVDASLVTPVLDSLGATVLGEKWLSDSNFYRFTLDEQEYAVVFDLPDDESHTVEVGAYRLLDDGALELGEISVVATSADWEALKGELVEALQRTEGESQPT